MRREPPEPTRRAPPGDIGQTPTPPRSAARVVGFIGRMARQLQSEFATAWEATAEAPEEAALPLAQRLSRLQARVEAAEQVLAAQGELPAEQVQGLVELAAGTEGMAGALRGDPLWSAQRAARARLAPVDRRAALTRPLQGPAVSRTASRTAPLPTGPEAELARARLPFDQAHAFVQRALSYAKPRLEVLAMAVEAVGVPGPRRPWEDVRSQLGERAREARLAPTRLQWMVSLAGALHADPEVARLAHAAVVQWRRATALMAEAEQVRRVVDTQPPARALAALRAFHAGQLRASVFPIGHLHLTFKGAPLLQDLFPAPSGQAPGTQRFQA